MISCPVCLNPTVSSARGKVRLCPCGRFSFSSLPGNKRMSSWKFAVRPGGSTWVELSYLGLTFVQDGLGRYFVHVCDRAAVVQSVVAEAVCDQVLSS